MGEAVPWSHAGIDGRDWCLVLGGEAKSCTSGGQGCAWRWLWAQDFRQPVCKVVVLSSHPVGGLAWGNPALEPNHCCVGPGLSAKIATSRRAGTDDYALGLYHQCPSPYSELQLTPTSPGRHCWDLQANSVPGAHGVIALPWFPVVMKPCMHPPEWSLCFPLVLWNSCSQVPVAFKSQMLWELIFPMPDPQAGEPDTGLRTLSHVGEPLAGTGFDYITKVPLLPSHCGFFVFGSRVSFLVGSSLSFWLLLIS